MRPINSSKNKFKSSKNKLNSKKKKKKSIFQPMPNATSVEYFHLFVRIFLKLLILKEI